MNIQFLYYRVSFQFKRREINAKKKEEVFSDNHLASMLNDVK